MYYIYVYTYIYFPAVAHIYMLCTVQAIYNQMITGYYEMEYMSSNQSALILQQACQQCLHFTQTCNYDNLCDSAYTNRCSEEDNHFFCAAYDHFSVVKAYAANTAVNHRSFVSLC